MAVLVDTLTQLLIIAFIVAALAVLARFELFVLRDINQSVATRYLTKQGWALLSIVSVPIGGILWFWYGKVR